MTNDAVIELHHKLQALDSRVLFLLGGSFARREALPDSDVDFYCVGSFAHLFGLRKKIKKILALGEGELSCVLMPGWIYRHGIYGFDALTTKGERMVAPIDRSAILMNCFLLGSRQCLSLEKNGVELESAECRRSLVQALAGLYLASSVAPVAVFSRPQLAAWAEQCSLFVSSDRAVIAGMLLRAEPFSLHQLSVIKKTLLELSRQIDARPPLANAAYRAVFVWQWIRTFKTFPPVQNPAILLKRVRDKLLRGAPLTNAERRIGELRFPIWIITT